MSHVLTIIAFSLHAAFRSMSRMFTLTLTSYPRLTKLFCLCKCLPFLCYTLVLSPLFLGVSFKLSLVSLWGCLRIIFRGLVCFIGSLEPFKMNSSRFFAYPLTKLFKIKWTNQHGSFFSCCHIGACAILEEVVQISERFLPALRGLWWMTNLLFRRNPLMPLMLPIPTTHWTNFQHFVFVDV
jgi:hypothetical protein